MIISNLSIITYTIKSQQLIIKNINGPSAVKVGDVDHVILDCDYALENTSSQGLVVKWFFNDNQLVYQWIYGRSPAADEPVAKYIDIMYKASDDPLTKYRAMKLNKPGIDLTGDYTCVISTFADERMANISMVMYCDSLKPTIRRGIDTTILCDPTVDKFASVLFSLTSCTVHLYSFSL
ncbi:hypothetical protein P5V15_002547 [Pogonomyrmex californicus]